MPHSMTAFARVTAEHPWGSLSCELRSVNHRYLELHFRLPESLRDTEMAIREQARKALQRGKVDIAFHLHLNKGTEGISVNHELANQLIQAAEQLAVTIQNPQPISAFEVLRWPGVMVESELDTDELKAVALALFQQATEELKRGRAREGEKLADLIRQRLLSIQEQVTIVRAAIPDILQHQRQRLQDKLADVLATIDSERLETELVMIANKSDVDEELDRLEAHLTEVELSLKTKGAIGRRLDFLMQELNREANTLGSKSIDAKTTQASVELKVLIEQMREQIQNIE